MTPEVTITKDETTGKERVRPKVDPSRLATETFESSDAKSHRQTASALRLMRDALGPMRVWPGKFKRFNQSLSVIFDETERMRRLNLLKKKGLIDQIPSMAQIFFGSLDMLRYYIDPGARDYYESRGINYTFHNLLKVLDDAASVIDPSGIRSPRDTIIGHVLHVVHANPIYDIQLLEMFDDGVEEMEKQTRQMLDGTHPRHKTISAIVEDPQYHQRLLDYIVKYRKDPLTPMLHRQAYESRKSTPDFILCEAQFGTLDGTFRYFSKLPKTMMGLVRHYLEDKTINIDYCDPDLVESYRKLTASESTHQA